MFLKRDILILIYAIIFILLFLLFICIFIFICVSLQGEKSHVSEVNFLRDKNAYYHCAWLVEFDLQKRRRKEKENITFFIPRYTEIQWWKSLFTWSMIRTRIRWRIYLFTRECELWVQKSVECEKDGRWRCYIV